MPLQPIFPSSSPSVCEMREKRTTESTKWRRKKKRIQCQNVSITCAAEAWEAHIHTCKKIGQLKMEWKRENAWAKTNIENSNRTKIIIFIIAPNHTTYTLRFRHKRAKRAREKQISAYVTRTTNILFLLNHFVFAVRFYRAFFLYSFCTFQPFGVIFFPLAADKKRSLHTGFFIFSIVHSLLSISPLISTKQIVIA